jgi:hypothetical protein
MMGTVNPHYIIISLYNYIIIYIYMILVDIDIKCITLLVEDSWMNRDAFAMAPLFCQIAARVWTSSDPNTRWGNDKQEGFGAWEEISNLGP